ncbi:MAG: N-acetyltransferase [Pseudomonadota bacterium]|nr:N-acetyltransferase [Pseudomonadota bacterium]
MTAAIRAAVATDAPALALIHAACFPSGWSQDDLAAFAGDSTCLCLLCGVDAPAGFILCRSAAGEAEILTLAVRPDSRRQGIGRRLVTEAMSRLGATGAALIFLEVDSANTAARGLYESLGFIAVGKRPGYYGKGAAAPPGDALVLRRDLP